MAKPSLQLSEDEWFNLISDVEASKGPAIAPTADRRNLDMVRYPYVRSIGLRVSHRESSATMHVVRARNLSSGGIGFFHGCFLYPDTLCHIAVQTVDGQRVAMAGKVSWCRHVRGRSHEIGLRFTRLIDVKDFLTHSERAGLSPMRQAR